MAVFKRRRKMKISRPWFPSISLSGKSKKFYEHLKQQDITKMALRPRRGVYLIPNAFTTAALFSGFYAIVMAMNLHFDKASMAIFAAMVLDSLDGRVARLTNTQSDFGAQYDSLSDMVSFGAAPSLVMYEWSLRNMGKLGWLAAFVYCAGCALRLARFNTNISTASKIYFQGLPSPAAAALVAGFVWLMDDLGFRGLSLGWPSWLLALYAGLAMVSNIPFYSFKDVNLYRPMPFITTFLVMLALLATFSNPSKVLFSLFVVYGFSGFIIYFSRQFRKWSTK
jgi:CDP-diacylglycerol--serine O-phosphatidyltransferase